MEDEEISLPSSSENLMEFEALFEDQSDVRGVPDYGYFQPNEPSSLSNWNSPPSFNDTNQNLHEGFCGPQCGCGDETTKNEMHSSVPCETQCEGNEGNELKLAACHLTSEDKYRKSSSLCQTGRIFSGRQARIAKVITSKCDPKNPDSVKVLIDGTRVDAKYNPKSYGYWCFAIRAWKRVRITIQTEDMNGETKRYYYPYRVTSKYQPRRKKVNTEPGDQ
eukprot:TRINITY_DN7987_c0_g1_i1.p1 TRINITY_DN7987_c0_g1~~TRINITY_DN7987_c0_g1_i1.p1  ORF type:complete len:220 (-),score=14.50 TRINITY_DN7987_c0_g1_i1:32-691(-)